MKSPFRARQAIVLLALAICCGCGSGKDASPSDHVSGSQLATDEPSLVAGSRSGKPEQRTPIARVLGKDIYEDELRPTGGTEVADATDLARYRREILHSLIWQPLMEKYCGEHRLNATKEEIEQYMEAVGNEIAKCTGEEYVRCCRNVLDAKDLQESERTFYLDLVKFLESEGPERAVENLTRFYKSKLSSKTLAEDERRAFADVVKGLEAYSAVPEAKVNWWKFDRALYAQYGGVVIFQQSNPVEPVGAYRRWLEDHEQAGDFQILDDEARAAFWEYFKTDWEGDIGVVHDPDPLSQPWWLKRSEMNAEE